MILCQQNSHEIRFCNKSTVAFLTKKSDNLLHEKYAVEKSASVMLALQHDLLTSSE